jgi:GTP cyclohydrolase I
VLQEVHCLLQLAGVSPTGQHCPDPPAALASAESGQPDARLVPLAQAVRCLYDTALSSHGAPVMPAAATRHAELLLSSTAGYAHGCSDLPPLSEQDTRRPAAETQLSPSASGSSMFVDLDSASAEADGPLRSLSPLPSRVHVDASMEASDSDSDLTAAPQATWQAWCGGRLHRCSTAVQLAQSAGRGAAGCMSLELWRVDFASRCEHHMLPFYGQLLILVDGWPSQSRPAALVDLVDTFCCRLQVQERITQQVADAVHAAAPAGNVLVVCDSAHMCMVARGVEKHGAATMTTASRGTFQEDRVLLCHALEQVCSLARRCHA